MGRNQMAMKLLVVVIASLFIKLHASNLIFYESFDQSFEDRWITSQKKSYTGIWKHSKSEGHEDYGLLVSEKAKKYAIVRELEEPVNVKDGTIVLQFDTRFQSGIDCGGAYLKYLRPQRAGWSPKNFDNESPYSIMFGPDRCGITNKVHFIFKHKNPKTGAYIEHHLKHPPSVPTDKMSHVYTAVMKPNNELRILIDGVEKKNASFMSDTDFDPGLIPPKTIPDPRDKKPSDWDERAKIPDPDAVKPDDWDEDAPMEIVDVDAVKPDDWLDDEPDEIEDPNAKKPEDWDDDEDGEWEPPKIENPKCSLISGCGEWKRPMKRNPAYKGKWYPPMIDNPNFKGIWRPRDIPNPEYFDVDKPNFEPIVAIGIEIWTMQEGILFDNILITSDEKAAESYRKYTWKPKFDAEKEKLKAEEAADDPEENLSGFQKKVFHALYTVAGIPLLKPFKTKIIGVIEKGEKRPNVTIGVLVSIVIVLLSAVFGAVSGEKRSAASVKTTVEPKNSETEKLDKPDSSAGEEEEAMKEDDAGATARLRRSKRET